MIKKYRIAWWRLQHWWLIILAVITLFQVGRSLTSPGVDLVPVWLRLVVVTGGLLMTAMLVWGVMQFFASYLQMSDEGVGVRHWPTKLKLVPWNKVERVGKYATLGIFKSDILIFKEMHQISGVESKEEFNVFTLSDFQGWPKGELADDLRKRRPQAFK